MNQTQGSGFILEVISRFKITIVRMGAHSVLGDDVPHPQGVGGRRSIFNPNSSEMSCLLQRLEVFQVFEQDPHSTEERDCKLQHMLDSGKYSGWLIWDDYRQNITWEQIRKLEILNKFSIFIYKMTSFIN